MEITTPIINQLTKSWMLSNGYKENEDPIEWDSNRSDSQYSIARDMVEFIVNGTIEAIKNFSDDPSDSTSEQDDEDDLDTKIEIDQYGKHLMGLQKGAVRQHANFFIFLSNPEPGIPIRVSDVREWLARVEELGVPDDREVEGNLYLDYDFDSTEVEKIECGECGQFDIITTTHHCDGRWLERYRKNKNTQET